MSKKAILTDDSGFPSAEGEGVPQPHLLSVNRSRGLGSRQVAALKEEEDSRHRSLVQMFRTNVKRNTLILEDSNHFVGGAFAAALVTIEFFFFKLWGSVNQPLFLLLFMLCLEHGALLSLFGPCPIDVARTMPTSRKTGTPRAIPSFV